MKRALVVFLIITVFSICIEIPHRLKNPVFEDAFKRYWSTGDISELAEWFTDSNHEEAWFNAAPMAAIAANFSLLAYANPASIEETLKKKGATATKLYVLPSHTGAPLVAYIGVFGDFCVIAFKGTTSAGDWLSNLNVVTTRPSPDVAQIHLGFYKAWERLKPLIVEDLKQLGFADDPPRGILVTGHSLGGALALIAGNELHHARFPVMTIFTFGQPRVYSAGFPRIKLAEHMEQYSVARDSWPSVRRYGFTDDIVPAIPPLTLGFYHVGRRFIVTRAGAQLFLEKTRYFAPSAGEHPMRHYLAATLASLAAIKKGGKPFGMGGEDDVLDFDRVIAWATSPTSSVQDDLGPDWHRQLIGFFLALPHPTTEYLGISRGMSDQRPNFEFR